MFKEISVYDTSLRDGAQTTGVTYSAENKRDVAVMLDRLGVSYIEGGFLGANPVDDEFFASPPILKKAKLAAFGMTRRSHAMVENDVGVQTLAASNVPVVCLVGKTSRTHVANEFGVTRKENLRMIGDSVDCVTGRGKEVLFDAEHFFDGYKDNSRFSLSCLRAAQGAGASWLVLCDTKGGTLPDDIAATVKKVKKALPEARLGIHCHNDRETAVAGSLAAVRAGCEMVQGTLNGIGERCGNANLVSVVPTLIEMGYDVGVSEEALKRLTGDSHTFASLIGRKVPPNASFVGKYAFAHKGGLHGSGVNKDPTNYEHYSPERVGNQRYVIISDQAGMANLRMQLHDLGINVAKDEPALKTLLSEVKQRGEEGYAYDYAVASFELLALRVLGRQPNFFTVKNYATHDLGSLGSDRKFNKESSASIKVQIGEQIVDEKAKGVGPFDALNTAFRKALVRKYRVIDDIKLTNYHVFIPDTKLASAATARVVLKSENTKDGSSWVTVGMSTDSNYASFQALCESFVYGIMLEGKKKSTPVPVRHWPGQEGAAPVGKAAP